MIGQSLKRFSFFAGAWLTACAVLAASPGDAETLAARIDAHLTKGWSSANRNPPTEVGDATFLRRVYLDLIGRIPTIGETRSFLTDASPDHRQKLIKKLLATPAAARHRATVLRRDWMPQADLPQWMLAEQAENWIARRLRDGAPYDQIVKDLLIASQSSQTDESPKAFLAASEYKPENLAANTTRAFLGINLDCAQCHNHPHARWTREQFWETAAFFVRHSQGNSAAAQFVLMIPETTASVSPRFLTGAQPNWPEKADDTAGRLALASWVASKDNPYFAKNFVNRLWAQYFGTGLVEPLDDLSGQNPASHPELLDDLAAAFAQSNFDMQYLTESLMLTRAYSAPSVSDLPESTPSRLFDRFTVRGMSGEQLYDSLRVAAGSPPQRDDLDQNAFRERMKFAEQFRIERGSLAQRSILQSLSLMNGGLIKELTTIDTSSTLKSVAGAPFLDAAAKVESLFLAALSRKPTPEELTLITEQLDRSGERTALGDLFWALLNSSEFSAIH